MTDSTSLRPVANSNPPARWILAASLLQLLLVPFFWKTQAQIYLLSGALSWCVLYLGWRRSRPLFSPRAAPKVSWGPETVVVLVVFLLFVPAAIVSLVHLTVALVCWRLPEPAATQVSEALMELPELQIGLKLACDAVTIVGVAGFLWLKRQNIVWWNWREVCRGVARGVGGCFVVLPPTYFCMSLAVLFFELQPHPIETMIRQTPDLRVLLLATLSAVVLAPLAEELIFRGVVFSSLAANLGVPLAAVASSLLFAALHHNAWPAPIPLFFFALGLTYLKRQTNDLVAPIVMHSLFNATSVVSLAYRVVLG